MVLYYSVRSTVPGRLPGRLFIDYKPTLYSSRVRALALLIELQTEVSYPKHFGLKLVLCTDRFMSHPDGWGSRVRV